MPDSAVQLFVWMIHLGEEDEERVAELLEDWEFTIATTLEPKQGELEYQTMAFADTDENVGQIKGFESALRDQFPKAEISCSGLDKSSQTTYDRPIKGAYRLSIKKDNGEEETDEEVDKHSYENAPAKDRGW